MLTCFNNLIDEKLLQRMDIVAIGNRAIDVDIDVQQIAFVIPGNTE